MAPITAPHSGRGCGLLSVATVQADVRMFSRSSVPGLAGVDGPLVGRLAR